MRVHSKATTQHRCSAAECTERELALRQLNIQLITSPSRLDNNTETPATSHGAMDNDDEVQERVVGFVKETA